MQKDKVMNVILVGKVLIEWHLKKNTKQLMKLWKFLDVIHVKKDLNFSDRIFKSDGIQFDEFFWEIKK